ncbi:MAG: PfkB family carbohydrate kinase [Planctomycetota bacterium]
MKSPTRVVTLTLHPAIDRVVKIQTMRPGGTFDGRSELTLPAGKGVNTARVLGSLCGSEHRIIAAAWTGENEASFFKTKLRELNAIDCLICPRAVPTRFAQTYLEADGRETHIKESMPAPTPAESRAFLAFWEKTVRPGDLVAVCGSAPKGTTIAFLKSVFRIAHERGISAIVADTNGPALTVAARSSISLLKGNALELGELLELDTTFQMNNPAHRIRILDFLSTKNAPQKVLITLGAEGALLVSSQGIFHGQIDATHFTHTIVSTTGCGDAATAGAVWGMLLESSDEHLLRRAVACGGAKTLSEDPGAISLKSVRRFVRYCLLKPLA